MRTRTHEGTPLPPGGIPTSPIEEHTRGSGRLIAVEAVTAEVAAAGPAAAAGEDDRLSVISFEYGTAAVRFFPGGIVRVTLSRGDARLPEPSYAVTRHPETLSPAVEETAERLLLEAEGLTLSIERKTGDFELSREPGDRRLATIGGAFRFNRRIMGMRFPLGVDDRVYGLGEKTGFLDKRGRVYRMWNTDESTHLPTADPLYVTVPLVIRADRLGAVGVFLDEPARSWFDIGSARTDAWSMAAESARLDLYIIVADQVSGVVERYTALTGRMQLPPVWALGFQQSRYSYYPDTRVREVAETFRSKKIPCDAVYLDIHYMRGYRVFTWDPERFPSPARLIRELSDIGMRVVTIVDPGVKLDPEYEVYRSGLDGDHYCRRPTGEVYEGEVWAGPSAFPDFTRAATRSWWAELHENLFAHGVAGIWNDMNEPADFSGDFAVRTDFTPPADVTVRPDGEGTRALERYHNVYGHNMCRATAEAFERHLPEQRPFILTRAAYAGTQRYAAVWTGDNHSWWEHLASMIPMVLNMGLSGFPLVGADVGGFEADATPELYARWIEAAAFTPFFRAHTSALSRAHEPWSFGTEVEQIARYYVALRYHLLPYIYGLFHDAARHGAPPARPLLWHYPADERTWNLNDEFLLGPDLLVAPILSPGARARSVYLPEGQWYDFRSGELLEGAGDVIAAAPLDTLPLYIRAPSVIPTATAGRNAEETLAGDITLHIYPGSRSADEHRAQRLYHDDGISLSYREGGRSVRDVLLSVDPDEVRVSVVDTQTGYDAAPAEYSLVLHEQTGLQEGVAVPTAVDAADRVIFRRGG
ncbi:MAG: TIM-barrel domain-containing protein [Spirochaetaceae bacterium]